MRNPEMGRNKRAGRGFTLIELMIVIVVIAILLSIAIPLYSGQVRKARRADAQHVLMDMALRQEKWRANNTEYGTLADIGDPCPGSDACDNYSFSVSFPNSAPAVEYTLTATATGDQAKDSSRGTPCTTMTLDQDDTKTPADCW